MRSASRICCAARSRRGGPLRQPSETLAELAALVRGRERFVVEHRRLQHQLRANLETYYPAMTHLFSSIDRSITLAFLRRFPTPEAAARLTEHRLGLFLRYTGRTAPAVVLARIREHPATPSAGTDRARVRGALALADLLEHVTRILAGSARRRRCPASSARGCVPSGPRPTERRGCGSGLEPVRRRRPRASRARS